jgi:putative exosortase-associated protein (TIGR04073 family)
LSTGLPSFFIIQALQAFVHVLSTLLDPFGRLAAVRMRAAPACALAGAGHAAWKQTDEEGGHDVPQLRLSVLMGILFTVGLAPANSRAEETGAGEQLVGEAKAVVMGMGRKFVRGVANGLTGILEIPMQTAKGYQAGVPAISNQPLSKAVGTVLGIFRGFGHSTGRTTYGVLEVTGFWTANPPSNRGVGIPFDARYAWQWGERYSLTEPTLAQGILPYPRKLMRGFANGMLGALDLPGQIVRGTRAERPWLGVPLGAVKGTWFTASRVLYYSYTDMALFLVPNPASQVGYPFSDPWPWGGFTRTPSPDWKESP